MPKIASNIKVLRDLKKMSQEALAQELNITRGRLGAYEEDRNEPPVDMLIRIADFFHISIDALVRADLKKTDPDALMKIGKNRILFPVLINQDNNDCIEVVTVKASAGYLNGYADPEYIEKLPQMNLPFKVTGKHRTFPIKGDSMLPLRDGSFVVGKYVESISDVKNGHTYVLITKDEGVVYKRVFKSNNHSQLELHSDNKSYSPYTVKTKDVLELWEFVCCINLSDKREDEINMDSLMNMLKSMKVEIESMKKS